MQQEQALHPQDVRGRFSALAAGETRIGTIALFGLFGVGNLGNDGSLEAMIGVLRGALPHARLVCICPRPDVVSRRFGIDAVSIRSSGGLQGPWHLLNRLMLRLLGRLFDLHRTLAELHGVDLVIVPGTGILDDFGERPYGMPLDIFKWCVAARLTGTRFAFASIGAGPIRHPVSRRLMVAAARLAAWRSYRDAASRDYMAGIGLDTTADPVCPDLAFALPTPSDDASVRHEGAPAIGVGVMHYRGWYRWNPQGGAIYAAYLSRLAAFVLWLLDRGHRVRLLVGQDTDAVAVADLVERVREVRPDFPRDRLAAAGAASLSELMSQIAETDLVVATRFHNIVCALKMGRPSISLGYAGKNDALLKDFGLGAYCQHVESFEVESLKAQFLELAGERETLTERIRARVAEYEDKLSRQDAALLDLFAECRRAVGAS